MKIAFIGNFSVPFSTESHHACTWEKLGHEVVRLQENKVTPDGVVSACQGAQLLQWTHTHSWGSPDFSALNAMLDRVHAMGVKSFAYHLDYYHGLNTWDRRDELVGKHPSWRVHHWFSTDGGHDEFFRSRGVNHHWLPPAVVEYGCTQVETRSDFMNDVGFAGSVNYHPEYPFRPRMVAGLQSNYTSRFRVFVGYREQALNALCARVKVMAGDHVFAGCPRYWSDRLPETCGRGGFLVYPATEGLTIPVATYRPQDLGDLFARVDYYLTHETEREELRRHCHEHVKAHDTYTHRLQEVLRVMNLG